MSTRLRVCAVIAAMICLVLAIPANVGAQGAQQAGKISIAVPTVYLVRASQQVNASPSNPVYWGDVVNTGHLARTRIALTDGSILNVGSDSNLTITKHDASAQQTDLELNYGRVRAKAVKLVKPDAHFQIRTAVGVAGVVGTEMIVSFETSEESGAEAPPPTPGANDRRKLSLLCMEGICKLCDLALNCVIMKGGEFSAIRGNSAPSQPAPITPVNVTQAVNSTNTTGAGVSGAASSAGGATGGTIAGVTGAVGAGVAVGVVRAVSKTATCPTQPTQPTGGVVRRGGARCTRIVTGNGGVAINGQRTP
ncbi:MAG: FecR family protein [Candidatus Acidiferrales bacterium]